MEYRKATLVDLEKIWDKDIAKHNGDLRYVNWKKQYIENNLNGKCTTFVVLNNDDPVGQITILFSPECSPVKDKPLLCNGTDTANMNAFRIEKAYEGGGHISTLVKMAETYAKEHGIKHLTIGAEARESRNLGIYLHWGYNQFVMHEIYEGDLVVYYKKDI
ncbi:MAG: GNAT family N-acetyltransferase [Clostridia bacterium]|nr:GNAT family N-acetyltransferase [Clostridia bacterium]